MGFGIQFFYAPQRLVPRIWVSVIAAIAVVGNIVMIILGATNPDPNSVGIHSPGDWMVVVALSSGAPLVRYPAGGTRTVRQDSARSDCRSGRIASHEVFLYGPA